jgi:plasmid stability protein
MRTTLNLPDELYRAVKVRAASDGRTVTSVVEEALRTLLAEHLAAPKPFVLRALPLRPGDDDDLPPLPFDLSDNSAVLDYLDQVALSEGRGYPG